MKKLYLSTCLTALVLTGGPAFSAEPPDAGQTLQDLRKAPSLPAPARDIDIGTPAVAVPPPGGPQVTVHKIRISGNSVFPDSELHGVIVDAEGGRYDLSGLKALASRITAYYHAHDYPFARALIPAQAMEDDTLEIMVVEGRYGAFTVDSPDERAESALGFMAPLKHGDIIKGQPLERAALILDDQPGYSVTPIIRPGQETGTGDLALRLRRDQRFGGSIGTDNHGNRYTGRMRGQLNLYADSPFLLGDQVTLNTLYTEENMWFGSAGYNAPLGYSGLRGQLGYAHTYYELGKQFAALDAHGTAQVASAGLSYPFVRSQKTNLSLSVIYQHKWLNDEQEVAGTTDKKSSDSLPVTMNFDRRDSFLGGGLTYGALSWTHGILDLDSGLSAADAATARSKGTFDKLNLDIARLQATPLEALTLYARASGQLARDNLDSSEDFGLGGPNGVRAYPVGEAYGDEGWFAQTEIRYSLESVTPYLFYDYGQSKTNHDTWAAGDNTRSIAGAGLGLRATYKGISADASAGWRTVGGDPQSDDKDTSPLLWAGIHYDF
jgi:hemolysin activation/secretion protein